MATDSLQLSYTHAYFSHVHRAYPFLDKERTIGLVEAFVQKELWQDDWESVIVGLVMAIGKTTLERAGKLEPQTSSPLNVPYSSILTRCLSSPSTEGLQILTLLSLYSLFDPQGVSTWIIISILTRQALQLGLSRMCSIAESSLHDQEPRHRLFWSIFVLDRMAAVSVGQPSGLVDENMNISQPAVTVTEFASPGRAEHASLLQLNRHIIQLRQLEHRIMTSIHLGNHAQVSKLTRSDRKAISEELRSAIDDWYSHACLVTLPEADNIPIHSTITWLNARYYNLLVLLYYPCHFNSQSRHAPIKDLEAYTSKLTHYNCILLEQRQLPLNYITLCRLIPTCLVFLYCFAVRKPPTFSVKSEVESCISMLRAFPPGWSSCHRTASIMTEFMELIAGHKLHASSRLVQFSYSSNAPLDNSTRTWLLNLQTRLLDIIRKALGNASCYLDIESWDGASKSLDEALEPMHQTSTTTPAMDLGWTIDSSFDLGYV
ncbi:hypothetical protein CC80DRAFT_483258 [Byssothecium circinans]|uniref:Xylanolytic transcriptional activator regulatory domain-containing protein n=1 Tax=Byssothecium circinans TaxID=147558 RepID=A0A6A5TC58_9PLEO|nr:hypothetical protein CC80DRAFT_483258 [Byssothecium circinans]